MDRENVLKVFRQRLRDVIRESGMSQMAFAESAGMDRSTLSQILSPKNQRLPRIESVIAISQSHSIAVDWLLGVTQQKKADAVIKLPMEIAPGSRRNHPDQKLAQWHAEAIGHKIRYVPTTLPDLLKTEKIIAYEYDEVERIETEDKIESSEKRLAYQRHPESDMEICSSVQAMEMFVRGEGLWKQLSKSARRGQVDQMIDLYEELYPTLRWYFFDFRQNYSVPMTIFGAQRAAIYVGKMYFVFNSTEHIRVLTRRFDELIREAVIQAHDVGNFLRKLVREAF